MKKGLAMAITAKPLSIRMKTLHAAICLIGKADKAKVIISRLQSDVTHSESLHSNTGFMLAQANALVK